MEVTSTQKGAIAENLVANGLMVESSGRLSPFQAVADDDGIDLLIFDKSSGASLPLQIKSRSKTIKKKNKPGETVHFEVRKATLDRDRKTKILFVLVDELLSEIQRAWLFPISKFTKLASEREDKYVIRPSKKLTTNDKYKKFQFESLREVANKIMYDFDNE